MNFMLKISVTNLLRRFYRSVIIILLIAIGVVGMMFLNGFYNGLLESMKGGFLRSSGHIVVEHKNYKESDLFEDRIPNAKKLSAQIASVDNVKVVAPKIVNEGLMATAASSRFVRITGVDLES
ncbi:MAG: hypothetical protein OEW60_06655, partial [Thiovulaceae bacterium]|nr:hypothetical protein [Sulfurimonadaceae bacterium]